MKSRILVAALSCTLLVPTLDAVAQVPGRPGMQQPPAAGSGEIRGSVVEAETNAPVASASVAVWSKDPAVLVTGALARPDGTFRIEGLRPGSYELRVSSIGFSSQNTDVVIDPASPRASAGNIRLTRAAIAIEGIEVTSERSMIEIAPDRNSYRARDLAPAGGTVSDVLRAVPSVDVDHDGKVSLRGNENVAVQINGRPTPLRGAQLAAYLAQIPSSMLDRVEVIPNPSARFDPDGMAGILNIVMKQNVDLGVSAGLTLSAANADRYNTSGNLGYQRGNLTLFNTYGYSADERALTGLNDRERYDALRAVTGITEQDIDGRTHFGGHNFNTNAEYKLNNRDMVFSGVTVNRRENGELTLSAQSEYLGDRTLTDRFDRMRSTRANGLVLDYTGGFKRTFEPQKHELSTEFRVNRSSEEDLTSIWRQPAGSSQQLEAELNEIDARTYQLTGQTDYTRTLRPRTKLETGYKGTGRWLDRDYVALRDPNGTGEFVRSGLSNSFEFDEQVHAVYGVLSHGRGKFDLQGGLRGEYADRDFALADQSYPHSYTSLFPSAVAMYKMDDKRNVRLSYSRRIRRPGTQELNPFPSFFDSHNVFIGNPALNPEYTDAFELSFQRTGQLGSFQVSPFYRHTSDVIRVDINTAGQVDGRDVTAISFINMANSDSWGTDVNGSLRLGPRFNGFGSFNIFKMVTDGGSESALSSDAVAWSARVNGTTQLNKNLALQGMYMYRAPMNIERGRFSASQMSSFSLRQKLDGDKASVSLRVTDPFNTMGMRVEAGDDNLLQITERKFGVRAVHLTFQYNYGQTPRMRQRRPEPTPEPQPVFGQ